MALVTRQHGSGLVLAEHGQDETALRHALKRMDDRLVLLPPGSWAAGDTGPSRYWRVMRHAGGDQPPVPVLVWMDSNQEPLPLSSGLLDEVQRHRKDGRNQGPDADARNARLVADAKKEKEDAFAALHDEYEDLLERGRSSVALGVRPRKPYWQRKYRGGHR